MHMDQTQQLWQNLLSQERQDDMGRRGKPGKGTKHALRGNMETSVCSLKDRNHRPLSSLLFMQTNPTGSSWTNRPQRITGRHCRHLSPSPSPGKAAISLLWSWRLESGQEAKQVRTTDPNPRQQHSLMVEGWGRLPLATELRAHSSARRSRRTAPRTGWCHVVLRLRAPTEVLN